MKSPTIPGRFIRASGLHSLDIVVNEKEQLSKVPGEARLIPIKTYSHILRGGYELMFGPHFLRQEDGAFYY